MGSSSWKDAVAGASAGALSRTLLAPIERVKLLLQLQSSVKYENLTAWQVFSKVYREQGITSFWRGNVPSMLRVSGTAAINFTCMDYYKRIATERLGVKSGVMLSLASGGLAGLTATTTLYPVEFLRTRLAMDVNKNRVSMNELMAHIWRTEGLFGFYHGFGIAAVGGVIYRIVLLGGYDALKYKINERQDHSITWGERFVLAQGISLTAATTVYPIDSIRRRLMMQAGGVHIYRNSIHCAREIVKKEGLGGFYLGFGVNIVRSLSGALLLVFYDRFRSLL